MMLRKLKLLATIPRHFGTKSLVWAAGLSVGLTFLIVVLTWTIDAPGTLSVISADVERVEFRVANPMMAWIPAAGFRQDGAGGKTGCLSHDVEPEQGQWLIYTRRHGEQLQITVADHPPTGEPNVTPNLDEAEVFVIDNRCMGPVAPRLPVHGPGSLGERMALRPDPGGNSWSYLLHTGSLAVYGRSLRMRGALFPVFDQPVPLPGGSRISTIDDFDGKEDSGRALVGFATPNENGTLDVELVTEARAIHLYPPGGRPEPTPISIAIFTRLLNDPTILTIQAVLFLIVATIPAAIEFARFLKPEEDSSRRGQAGIQSRKKEFRPGDSV